MTPAAVWHQKTKELLGMLNLPCKLRYSEEFKVGGHKFTTKGCQFVVNPTVDFKVPEHLILHEAAHHIIIVGGHFDCYSSHCVHWAEVLLGLYKSTGTELPYGTQFETFARVAGIHRTLRGN